MFQTLGRTTGKATRCSWYSIVPRGRKALLVLPSHCVLEHPVEVKAAHRDVPLARLCSGPALLRGLSHKGSGQGLAGEPLLKLHDQVSGLEDAKVTRAALRGGSFLGFRVNIRASIACGHGGNARVLALSSGEINS